MAQQTENNMKLYRKKALVQAKLFEKGDEDGFITRYYDDGDVHEDGSISTWGFGGEHSIEIPYVSTLENQQHIGLSARDKFREYWNEVKEEIKKL